MELLREISHIHAEKNREDEELTGQADKGIIPV